MIATRELIDSFHQYAIEQIQAGEAPLSVDQLYDRWRTQQEHDETIRSIRTGLEQMRRGEGMTLDEADRQIREHVGLLPRQS